VQLALVASAVFSCVGQIYITLGLQIEKAGIASVMRYFDVVFVFILDTVCLGETVDAYSILGGLIIMSGAVVIAIRRARAKK
jgi:drug/metabolite transporter (DMT)-like permease